MIDQAVRDQGIDMSRSYVVGDHARDIELAKRAGAHSLFVTTGNEAAHEQAELAAKGMAPDHVAASLGDAAVWILSKGKSSHQHSAVSCQSARAEKLNAES
jgi:heptosyltransferase-2